MLFTFKPTATTEIYPLSLHDALPISNPAQPRKSFSPEALEELVTSIRASGVIQPVIVRHRGPGYQLIAGERRWRSEEHTSELQSHSDLVCRLLLEKKKTKK